MGISPRKARAFSPAHAQTLRETHSLKLGMAHVQFHSCRVIQGLHRQILSKSNYNNLNGQAHKYLNNEEYNDAFICVFVCVFDIYTHKTPPFVRYKIIRKKINLHDLKKNVTVKRSFVM